MKLCRLVTLAFALAAVALPGGCGPKDAPDVLRTDHCPVEGCKDAAGVDSGPLVIPYEPLEPWDMTGAGPLSGVFAVETIIGARVGIPVETRQIFRLRILQHGATLKQKTTRCAFKLPKVEGVATLVIPPALQALFQEKHVEVEGKFLSSEQLVGAAWNPTPSLLLVGADLKKPETDPLPKIDDPATPTIDESAGAIDEDADGHPGVTLKASVVTCGEGVFEDLYVALRTGVELGGKVVTLDRIEGSAYVTLDQSVVGMSHKCLLTAAKLNIQVDPGSPFKAVRVGDEQDMNQDGNVSCPELAAEAVPLFGQFWAD